MTTNTVKHPSDCAKCAICQCRCCINKRTKCSRVKKDLSSLDSLSQLTEHRCLLILVRHGTSQDEMDKRYSGWNDCDLSNIGKEQMQRTGQALRQGNFSIDLCFTSVLKRASKSLFIIQEEMDCLWLPVYNTWRLNDRMLGSLTGFHRDRAEALFGQNQIKDWLIRSELAPPVLEESNSLHPRLSYKYRSISSIVPSTETLIDVRKRILPFFYDQLMNKLYLGKNILVVTHEEIIKTIIRLLNNYSIDEFENQEVPVSIPIVFEMALNTRKLLNGYYLSSLLLEKNTDYHRQPFPTGFSSDSEKRNSTQNIIEQSQLPLTENTNVQLEQNVTGTIDLPNDTNNTHEMADSIKATSSNDKQQDETKPEFALPTTTGTALYELATLHQPNQNDGGAFSDNANITASSHKKDKQCCSSLSPKLTSTTNKLLRK